MSKTETIDEVFHVHKWKNTNYLLSTSHSGDTVLEWLTDNKATYLRSIIEKEKKVLKYWKEAVDAT